MKPTSGEIIDATAQAFGITDKEIRGPYRHRRLIWPRHIAIHIIRDVLGKPYEEIGKLFGGRDHSTIIYAIWNVEQRIAKDRDLRAEYDRVLADIEGLIEPPMFTTTRKETT